MRKRPIHFNGALYHVMLRGNRKQEIFRDERDYRHLDRLVGASLERYGSEVHAYCWMPNHLHLLMRAGVVPVHRAIHYFAMMYAKYFNFRHGHVGHLFQGRYKSRLVDSDGYFLQLLRYIHLNPVKAGLAERVEQYRSSSMQTYMNLTNCPYLNQSIAMQYFSHDRRRFYRFMSAKDDSFDPWAEADQATSAQKLLSHKRVAHLDSACQNLDAIMAAACGLFGVSPVELLGASTRRDLTLARCWIGREAMRSSVATLSTTARYLNRSPAALSKSLRTNADRLAKVKG
jgi:REP element-mobilizing transposase RayT